MYAARQAYSTLSFVGHHPGARGRRVRAVAGVVMWQAWERLTGRPLTVRLPGGARMRCYPHSTTAANVLYTRMPEWDDMHFAVRYLRPGDLFVDVGANVGVYSLLAGGVPGVSVIAVEPDPANHRRLVENIELNGWQGRIAVVEAALGAERGAGQLSIGLDAMNHLLDQADTTGRSVRVETLDSVSTMNPQKVSLVKIDVEGAEAEVLRGAKRLLQYDRPALIIEANDVAECWRILAPHGYELWRYDADHRSLRGLWDGGSVQNILGLLPEHRERMQGSLV